MPLNDLKKISTHVQKKLMGLSPSLSYHSIEHTLDVVKHSNRIGLKEHIDKYERYLLKVAALYHDTGFLEIYTGHEKKSCEIFLNDAKQFNFTPAEKKLIVGLIMATKVPQRPKTLLQKIICDADLDYLGRTDFPTITKKLKKEFLHYAIVKDELEWKKIQKVFLKKHKYHTETSKKIRESVKQKNYSKIL